MAPSPRTSIPPLARHAQVKYRYEGGHEKMALVAENGALHLEPPRAPAGGPSAVQAPVPAVRAPAESYKVCVLSVWRVLCGCIT